MVVWCSSDCALIIARQRLDKKKAQAAKEERQSFRKRKEDAKTRSEWLKEAKVAIQQARRLEELTKGRGCMSCQRTQEEVQGTDGWKPGGAWDGGHLISKGARPELALEPLNIWLQCKSCNAGSSKYARKGYTVGLAFEENLRATEGDTLVDWLKGSHEPKHYDISDLKAIKEKYKKMARELKKNAA